MMAERPSSAGKSLDVKLVTEEPDLVMAHLKARHASEEQMSSVADISVTRSRCRLLRAPPWPSEAARWMAVLLS